MNKVLLSTAYIYPICPLSFNHARMFVIADIYARYEKLTNKEVYFPIATHYSGNTAQKIAVQFLNIFSEGYSQSDNDKKLLRLYKDIYKLPMTTIREFVDPMVILDYYNEETLWELKMLDVDANYTHKYTTGHPDFSAFVKAIINNYKKHNLLVTNSKNQLALKYEDTSWREAVIRLIESTPFVHPKQQGIVLSAMKNIRSDWGLLRDSGYGAVYNNQIVDPMFDSEIFSVFDVYIKYRDQHPNDSADPEKFFSGLFETIQTSKTPANELEKAILDWLPCDIFICEEHLRNWLAKKMHTESLLFNKIYQTKKYIILGTGSLEGQRMSASQGNAILSKDLIEKYGTTKARYVIIMQGGQLSKDFAYGLLVEKQADAAISRFNAYYAFIKFRSKRLPKDISKMPGYIKGLESDIIDSIESGYPRNALTILMDTIPKKFAGCSNEEACHFVYIYNKYLGILIPSLLTGYKEANGENV